MFLSQAERLMVLPPTLASGLSHTSPWPSPFQLTVKLEVGTTLSLLSLEGLRQKQPYLACTKKRCLVAQLCLTLCGPMDCIPPGSSVYRISQARHWSGLPFPSSRDLPNPGIKPVSSALVGGFSSAELLTSYWKQYYKNCAHFKDTKDQPRSFDVYLNWSDDS